MHHGLQQRHASSVADCIIKACLCQGVVQHIGARDRRRLQCKAGPGEKVPSAGPCEHGGRLEDTSPLPAGQYRGSVLCAARTSGDWSASRSHLTFIVAILCVWFC